MADRHMCQSCAERWRTARVDSTQNTIHDLPLRRLCQYPRYTYHYAAASRRLRVALRWNLAIGECSLLIVAVDDGRLSGELVAAYGNPGTHGILKEILLTQPLCTIRKRTAGESPPFEFEHAASSIYFSSFPSLCRPNNTRFQFRLPNIHSSRLFIHISRSCAGFPDSSYPLHCERNTVRERFIC